MTVRQGGAQRPFAEKAVRKIVDKLLQSLWVMWVKCRAIF